MHRSLKATAIIALVGHCSYAAAQGANETSTFSVNPAKERSISDRDRFLRTSPYISVFRVNPPATSMCQSGPCWPSASFFVFNPDLESGQDVTVECAAFSQEGALLGSGRETPQLFADELGQSIVLFWGNADFDRFARVDCKVVRAVPNSLGRR